MYGCLAAQDDLRPQTEQALGMYMLWFLRELLLVMFFTVSVAMARFQDGRFECPVYEESS